MTIFPTGYTDKGSADSTDKVWASDGVTNFNLTVDEIGDENFSNKTTTDLAEGTNEYYTDAKVDARITGKADLTGATFTGSISATNLSGTNTGDQTEVSGKSGNTDALNSATTSVNVSSATAPTTGQVLTATSSTAATWQNAGGGTLELLSTSTIGTVSTIDYDNTIFTSDYDSFIIRGKVTCSSSSRMFHNYSNDNLTTIENMSYNTRSSYGTSTSVTAGGSASTTDAEMMNRNFTSTANRNGFFFNMILGKTSDEFRCLYDGNHLDTANTFNRISGASVSATGTNWNSIRLGLTGGTFTGGYIEIYGLKN